MIIAASFAVYEENLAAVYVALGVALLVYGLHAIEFKLNKLLDRHDISVPDYEIAQDSTD
jgi:predicted Kef-type K+ transport protein